MEKKYIVRLSDAEREQLGQIVKQFSGSSQRVRRAQILLKVESDGPAWTDARVAEAFGCRTNTVENIRQRLVEFGFAQTLEGKQRAEPARPKCLTGDEEARIIATRLGKPPKGYQPVEKTMKSGVATKCSRRRKFIASRLTMTEKAVHNCQRRF